MNKITFAIIGSGWRTEFFLRIVQALPEQFAVNAVLVRNPDKRAAFTQQWDVPAVGSLDELLTTGITPQFVVVSVPWAPAPDYIFACAERGMPVLCETPPAPTLEGLIQLHALTERGAVVDVAEQYIFQPLHMARLNIIESGKLGTVTQAQVSIAHGYHGINLMRRFLGMGFENVTINARKFTAPLVQGLGRNGLPSEEKIAPDSQLMAYFDFENGKLGTFDFTGSQYFSWVRSNRLLVRGERGELIGTQGSDQVRWLQDFRTPMSTTLQRHDAGISGNLEGFFHKGYSLGAEWVYQNPFTPGRLSDDEIAIAVCLQKTAEHAAGGPAFYGLPEASQDHYLSLLMNEAAETGKPVTSVTQPWAG